MAKGSGPNRPIWDPSRSRRKTQPDTPERDREVVNDTGNKLMSAFGAYHSAVTLSDRGWNDKEWEAIENQARKFVDKLTDLRETGLKYPVFFDEDDDDMRRVNQTGEAFANAFDVYISSIRTGIRRGWSKEEWDGMIDLADKLLSQLEEYGTIRKRGKAGGKSG